MAIDVREVVARRGDLGTFVVHMARDREDVLAKEALKKIIEGKQITATSPFGHAVKRLESKSLSTNSQKAVCFTETPLEYVYLLLNEISGRQVALKPYGVAITKKVARKTGVNPVWYVDITPRNPVVDWLSKSINDLVDQGIATGNFDQTPIAKIAPFIEQMGTKQNAATGEYEYRKEFWWEREWRIVGNYTLPERIIVLCPSNDRAEIEAAVVKAGLKASFVDPAWGLERIIASLAGFSASEVEML